MISEKKIFLPVYQPSLKGKELEYVTDCIKSTWISSKGKYINLFEDGFAKYIGINHATSVSNGTVALHLALLALGISEGDEVIVPTLTYIASVNAIRYTGATPVFADSELDSWQVSPNSIAEKISSKTKAILVVHLYGQACNMSAIMKVANDNKIFVVEDCAEAIGSKVGNQFVGTFGDISTFSFFGNKTITTGEGGMVITKDETLYKRCIHLKGQGLAMHRQYWHDIVGYNYRMTNLCAAIGLAQLERIESILLQKRKIADFYSLNLPKKGISFHNETEGTYHSYWMCSILVDEISDRDPLREFLEKKGIETRPLFYPVHTMPMYSEKYQKFPNAEFLGWRGINLPSYPELKIEELEYICETIKSYFDGKE